MWFNICIAFFLSVEIELGTLESGVYDSQIYWQQLPALDSCGSGLFVLGDKVMWI